MSGEGGRLTEGRWNSVGRPVVYTAESSALAMLEILVGLTIGRMPPTFQLLRIDCPEGLAQAHFPSALAPAMTESRRWGEDWLRDGDTALARVPSAVAPHACNWLINPAHPAAQTITVVAKGRWPWDKRLFR